MKYLAPIIVFFLAILASPANAGNSSPAAVFGLSPPTCSIYTPNIQPPQCVDTSRVLARPRLCSSANPSVVPPACSPVDLPFNALSPGESLSIPQLADICNERYLANVPAESTVLNGKAQQVFVNNHFPFKKSAAPCVGGCTLDSLIPLSLGGSNNIANKWPQPDTGTYTTAMKNTLEATLRERVCTLDPYGFQKVNFTLLTGGTATDLVGATTYTSTIVAGGVSKSISILGSDAQTFTTLVNEINTDLSYTAGFQGVNVGGAKVVGSPTGLANDATVYTASVAIEGVPTPISIVGGAAQTYTTLLSELNTDLSGNATATIVNGNLRITATRLGVLSTVAITDVDLFSTLTNYVAITAPVIGTNIANATIIPSAPGFQNVLFSTPKLVGDATGLVSATTYTATITVDGSAKAISILGSAAQTFTTLINEINTDLAASAVASVNTLGNIQVLSATAGSTSTVAIVDSGTNHLFAALTSYDQVGPAFSGPNGSIKITATIIANPSTVSITAGTLFASPLANLSTISPAVVAHPTLVNIDTARGELTGNWKGAYDRYVTNQE
ncbi:hypothetical protein M0R04_07310 [Candidatus Dojkabacteria bacterium]|jgi:hypothetical protein|nr:hypothetical protein [Candidatus Dojkabacteria bacterium]